MQISFEPLRLFNQKFITEIYYLVCHLCRWAKFVILEFTKMLWL